MRVQTELLCLMTLENWLCFMGLQNNIWVTLKLFTVSIYLHQDHSTFILSLKFIFTHSCVWCSPTRLLDS